MGAKNCNFETGLQISSRALCQIWESLGNEFYSYTFSKVKFFYALVQK